MAFQKVLTSFIIISSGNWACLFICLTATTVSATATLCSSGYTCNNPKTLGDFVTADLAAAAGEHYLIDLLLTYSCACLQSTQTQIAGHTLSGHRRRHPREPGVAIAYG